MGEKSKKIGEIGENIVGNFFGLLGWEGARYFLVKNQLNTQGKIQRAGKENRTELIICIATEALLKALLQRVRLFQ